MTTNEPNEIDIYAQMAAEAAAITAIEIVTWSPIKPDDHCCGRVIDTGTIELPSLRTPGEIDVWPTNILAPIGEIVMDGKVLDVEGKHLRVAWLGPVQLRYYQSVFPDVDNVVSMHYQHDQAPKSGLNDYKVVNCLAMDHTTGKAKKPRALLASPTGQLVNVSTGELVTNTGGQLPTFDEFRERNAPTGPPPPPFTNDEEKF